MKSPDHDHESLLSDLFQGPDVEAVVETIRREKIAATKRRRMAAGATMFVVAAAACCFSLLDKPTDLRPVAHVAGEENKAQSVAVETTSTAEFPMERINDEQLIALLEGHPVALVHLPSGKQQLLLVEEQQQGEGASIISL